MVPVTGIASNAAMFLIFGGLFLEISSARFLHAPLDRRLVATR